MERRTSAETRPGSVCRTRKPAAVAAPSDRPERPVPAARTQATYRGLLLRGLASNEAATLTGYLAGIPVGQAWTLREVNQLLFLRELDRRGSWATETNAGAHAGLSRPAL